MSKPKATVTPVRRTNGAKKAVAAAVEQATNAAAPQKPPTLLQLAHAAVHGSRQENYGDQLANFQRIADRMTLTLQEKLVEPITALDVAMLMVDVKMGRLTHTGGTHRDSWIDVAGYAECADIIRQAQAGEMAVGS